jgi:fido (protein-threonine AMPylation protein)
MYTAIEDPYCYPGTTVLKNRAGHRTQRALTQFETAMSAQRADEPLPIRRLMPAFSSVCTSVYAVNITNNPSRSLSDRYVWCVHHEP